MAVQLDACSRFVLPRRAGGTGASFFPVPPVDPQPRLVPLQTVSIVCEGRVEAATPLDLPSLADGFQLMPDCRDGIEPPPDGRR
jgi:hypothetical protein